MLVIDHFIREHPAKKCLFLVPTRALVSQQSAYLRAHCARTAANAVRVSELCGDEPDAFNRDKWLRTLADSDILVGTPEVFKRAFVERAFLRPSDFCLIVFDECHHAVGNSPMAQLMRDSVLQAPECDRPRILGLTASFISGAVSAKSVLKKRQELEVLFQANFFSPDVSADLITALDAIGRRADSLADFVASYRSLSNLPPARPGRAASASSPSRAWKARRRSSNRADAQAAPGLLRPPPEACAAPEIF